MKKASLVLVSLFLSLSACKAQVENKSLDWKEFTSEEGSFKITFPGTPIKSVREKNLPTGKILNTWFEVALPKSYFALWYADLPTESISNQEEINSHYNYIRDGLVQSNLKLVTEREVKLGKTLGREIIFTSPEGITFKTRLYLIGKRQFQLITTFDSPPKGSAETEKDANKFLESFQFTEK